ncbi:MAG: LLM class F420-dependent oxidoreductase [Gaiellaceae bacterium]
MTPAGAIGVWSPQLREGDARDVAGAATELEEIGFATIWVPGREPGDLEERLHLLLSATKRITVATGIVSIWTHPAGATAALHARLTAEFPGRFLLGLGVSHAPAVGGRYRKPLTEMARYLDSLDAADPPVPRTERVLAALAPRMLALARERAFGSHPYLVTPEHTRTAREALGPDALLAPEQTVVLEEDPDTARTVARAWLARYLELPNYAENWVRIGFDRADIENGGSDRLVDRLVAWGGVDAIRAKVDAQRAAGADHVALQVVTSDPAQLPREEWRRLAAAFR